MADPRQPDPAALVIAAFSRHAPVLDWARALLAGSFGPIAFASPEFEFNQTSYYEETMGAGLRKQLLVFRDLVALDTLAASKLRAIGLEKEVMGRGDYIEPRPLNLDPGVLTLGKFMLATTKDQAHRIYLRDGIFAEVTLRFQAGVFEPWPWTYADYRQPVVLEFLARARDYLRRRLTEVIAKSQEQIDPGE